MLRAAAVVLALCRVAHAEDRLELAHVPNVTLVEPVFPLDRHVPYDERTKGLWTLSLALGLGDGAEAVSVGGGAYDRRVMAALRSELVGGGNVARGHHRGLLELRSDYHDPIQGALALKLDAGHGDAMLLAPAKAGTGPRTNADATLDGLVLLGSKKGDFLWVGEIAAAAGATHWQQTPVDTQTRRALGLGLGLTAFDGELPRGSIDVVRGRVEHATIRRRVAAAATEPLATDVRVVELGTGVHELTFHIDHELLVVAEGDLGWSWLDTGVDRDNAFRMRLGTGLEWLGDGRDTSKLGIAIARDPTYTPDAELVSEWRTELLWGRETRHLVLDARGAISWVDGEPRYGSQLDGFVKLGGGIEVGAYEASAREGRWNSEAGVQARWRH